MKVRDAQAIYFGVLMSLALMSCGKFMANLRRDLDDSEPAMETASGEKEPAYYDDTVGGRWPERGYLGHYDRSPASSGGGETPMQRPWISRSEQETNQRDRYRTFASSGQTPNLIPETKRLYKSGSRATRDDFVDQSQEEGSLWASSGQTNYYFIKNKIRNPGDLITLTIENDLYRDIGMEVKQMLSPSEKAKEIGLIQDKFRSKFLSELEASNKKDVLATAASAPERAPAAEANAANPQVQASPTPPVVPVTPSPTPLPTPLTKEQIDRLVPKATLEDVDIFPSLELKAGETMMGEIIERFPNGNYKIRTVKRVPYKKGSPRLVSVVGIVKASDIAEDTDLVISSKLYEYRVEVAH
jgi:hypothetical protein